MIISTTSLRSVEKGYRAIFDAAYQGIATPWFETIAMDTTSTGAEEEYHWLGAVPGMRELLGEVAIRNLIRHGWTIKNREWESTIGIKRVNIERDKLDVYRPLVQTMGEDARTHPGELVAELLSDGFTLKDYTGKAFFAVDKRAYAKANPFTNKGTQALSSESYSEALANLQGRLNAEGRAMRLGVKPVLLVPPALGAKAREILLSEQISGTTNLNRNTAELQIVPELAAHSNTAWFLIETGRAVKPFVVQTEKQPTPAMVTDDNDSHVVLKQEYLYQVYGRYNVGYALPEFAYGSTGAES